MSLKKFKLDKNFYFTVAFIIALIILTVIVMNLSVGAFTIVMPIFAGLIFLAIFLVPDEEEKPRSKK
ncbi:hypothetical protein A3J17_01315 [Candidatus Curtissbacteria bacterium RIFCSPLOWO2_02_FULL_40_11]|uniref:Uncharacterized protein n=2 Tax=Candidatus Curtissiibacteriota TaxID=1752717 RepID=A0A1F5GBB4_9BACT|nr:MAG: hypothetical protein A3D04_03565 [Candidatus Curtissbacteria bacterium RIFCSPHIGHO2_02_FULL_40_16b]OGE00862.1 MAG: hypothetical protein A3J17_01315 [Candidatus Curtissbacteria bacterium RIFCSPLOWO2_02_FULL_40_11]OGE14050.1 MAG: hypothetical protein A3G14_03470 [Candidatus Curtissbacteria bacterium RIFCSPLOWO2_12_FULL_38_9]